MSNLIPPLLSSTPPPIIGPLEEDDDDEFGDFRAAADSYDCDDLSLPASPQKSPEKEVKSDLPKVNLDINSNSQKITITTDTPSQNVNELIGKDFQDRRKSTEEPFSSQLHENQVNCSFSHQIPPSDVLDVNDGLITVNEIGSGHKSTGEDPVQTNFINDSDQIHDFNSVGFTDIQCRVQNPIINCDETEDDTVNKLETTVKPVTDDQSQDDLNSSSNEENIFEDFSESVYLGKTNSELSELNETNEIKSEVDCLEEINSELVNEDDVKDDKIDNSSKELNDDCSELSLSLQIGETDPKLSDDDFGNFEDHFANEFQKSNKEESKEPSEDEFEDFVSPLPPPQPATDCANDVIDDDFGDFTSSDLIKEELDDFGDFSSHANSSSENPVTVEINSKDAVIKSEIILKEIFPVTNKEVDDFEQMTVTRGNLIFNELKDITETNALLYQWSKSNSQKMFLKALNIDLRNILYGPAWNTSMPRFAANLGLTPLEPVKSEILTPTTIQNASSPSNSSQRNNSDIPTAQFDWSGSGLINPLDYSQTMLLDLEQLVASLDIPSTSNSTSNQSQSPSSELLYEWDLWLQSSSTALPGNVPEDSSQSHVKIDFLPGSNSEKSEPLSSLFDNEPLQKPPNDQVAPLEIASSFSLPVKLANDQLDDFTPFQSPKVMIPLRETHISNEAINDFGNNTPGWLEPTILTPDLPRKEPISMDPGDDEEEDEFDDFQMVLPEDKAMETSKEPLPHPSEFDLTTETIVSSKRNVSNQEHIPGITLSQPVECPVVVKTEDEEEFTDFHCHSSLPQGGILTPLPMEPLKPSVQYTVAPLSTQINWPDPGVSDEDIRNIELSYSRKAAPKVASKEKCVEEEEEWSDFVSVNTAAKAPVPERTATPDLPLSVLNLNSVQAPKQPIPVITPSGLLQTKLSSNMLLQASNVVQTTLQPNLFKPQPSQFQPSIISNLFPNSNGQDEDEDWSDFVSSQPLPQNMSNGFQPRSQPKSSQWASATTNIIMNPSHFDSFSNYVPQQSKKTTSAAKAGISSISAIPDLEFIAPKSRTKK